MINNPMQMIKLLSSANNPMAMMQNMLGSNPNYQKIMNLLQGKNPLEIQNYVENVCRTQGIDINNLARQFNLPL